MRAFLRLARTYAGPHRWSYLAGALALLVTNYLSVSIPGAIGAAIDALRVGGDVATPVTLIAAMGVGLIVVRTLSRVLLFNPGRDIEYRLRGDIFARLLAQQPRFYASRSTGDIVNRASSDLSFVRALVGYGFMQVLNVSMALTLAGWKMFAMSWQLTLAVLVPIAAGLLVTRFAIGAVFRLHQRSQEQLGVLSDHVLGSIQGVASVQGFVAEEAFVERFEARNIDLFRTRMTMSVVGSLAFPALFLAGGVALYVLVHLGGTLAVRGALSVGQVAAFAALLGVLLPPLRSLGWMLGIVERGRASLHRIFELMDAPIERPEGDQAQALTICGGPGLRLRDLRFAYPDDPERLVLDGISVDIPAGATVGVFGRTGSGKTTLLRVIARLYNPDPGSVLVIDAAGIEVDLTRLDLAGWRQHLAMAPQRPFLFSDTIRRNVALGEHPVDVEQAVAGAALGPDLAALPDGLETVVGERGIMLSGGQRQRVALARALARPAELILLDDVLSAVDHRTEARLLQTFADLPNHPTTFIVSHRMSALRGADLILVLDGGRLVACGTHAELLAADGIYRDTWRVQSEGEP